ncbi:uncharacterized protein LOC142825960 [Pelodiscus sinensis]|uniref:uncharacterized protein LOC142825960 n=1 Tax=Pelodiscus sinensis TaxID=13735 RepID=UPI003F6CDF41
MEDLASLRAHPLPLSLGTLQGVRAGLERSGELGMELGACLDLALERFCHEPQCVQENARLRVQWEAGALEFVSGQGQCELSVSCRDGEPQYTVAGGTGTVYLAWLRSHPEPLSVAGLARVRDRLQRWGVLEEELGSCFALALQEFSQEPRCVQENTRLRLRWGGEELEFVSGQGQCKILVLHADGQPRYHITEPARAAYLALLRSHPEPLSVADLARVRDRLGRWGALGKELSSCFEEAIAQFSRELPCVQTNARLQIWWSGQNLAFLAGQGQCEISVCSGYRGPSYEVKKLPLDVDLARIRARTEPLSTESLSRLLSRSWSYTEPNRPLRPCLQCALNGFSREPRWVQANARLRIHCGGEELEFVSGQGLCEISVLHADGRPQYGITALGADMPVPWSDGGPEPLSVADLARVRDRLGCWGVLGEELSSCLDLARQEFSQELSTLQNDARLRIRWGGGELHFQSGLEGACELSVCYRDGSAHYQVEQLPLYTYLEQLRARPPPLSPDTLLRVLHRLDPYKWEVEKLRICLDWAWQGLRQEPRCVQAHARLQLNWDFWQEFVSGQGLYGILVLHTDGDPQYRITTLGGETPVTWSDADPEPLSVANLARVRDRLKCWGVVREELSSCFEEAIARFSREPLCLQANARLRLCGDGSSLVFLSGAGACEISMRCEDGSPCYKVEELPVGMYLARFRPRPQPLSPEALQSAWQELESCKGDRDATRACFLCAWEGFCQEPRWVQANAQLRIRCGGEELEFVSGQGLCEISVLLADGEPQYHVTELGADTQVPWSDGGPEPLSVADLARVRDRLGHWGALGQALSGCFEEAVARFSREPPCLQENTRLRLSWDRGSLVFLSGDGACEVSVVSLQGTPLWLETKLPLDMYLARIRARREPLSPDMLTAMRDKLYVCQGDTKALSVCVSWASSYLSREPQGVQASARLRIHWAGGELEFTSGAGECELTVREAEPKPQYHLQLPLGIYLAHLRSDPEYLSVHSLEWMRDKLRACVGDTAALAACLDCAWEGFRQEPRWVQANARLQIRWGGEELEFVSGQGLCEISVLHADGEPQYCITALGADRPVPWSDGGSEQLSVAELARVQDRLGCWGVLGEELGRCFEEAIAQFSREPPCVQENAQLRLSWDGGHLDFFSGKGACAISVSYHDGRAQYDMSALPAPMFRARLRSHPPPLSADTLWHVRNGLHSRDGQQKALVACFDEALRGFNLEPGWVQGNARLAIWDGDEELVFVSGEGENRITVREDEEGVIQYTAQRADGGLLPRLH